jgi:hypothetical protein
MLLDPEELVRRRPVWSAMSDLFLDTEVRWQLPFVVRACARSSYELAALDRIFWVEVFPLAIGNLMQVAGEWGMLTLDERALIERANTGSMPTLRKAIGGSLVEAEWAAVKVLVGWLRAEPEERWSPVERAWDVLCHRYFERPGERLMFSVGPKVAALRAEGFELEAEWKRFEPIARSMLISEEAKTAGARAQEVLAVLAG